MAVMGIPAGKSPIKKAKKLKSLSEILPLVMMLPERMKRGMASMGVLSRALTILRTTYAREAGKPGIVRPGKIVAKPRATAMGTPRARPARRIRNNVKTMVTLPSS